MSKILTIAAGACGYVLGARAGRERYEQIRNQARRLWRDPRVQEKTDQAATVLKDKAAPAVKEQVSKAAKQVADKAKSSQRQP
jgi:SLT domain-containing protein